MTVEPSRRCTSAVTCWPQRSCGVPTTAASNTSSWRSSTASTSSGCTFSPPVLMHTEPRPSTVTEPSSSRRAKSPGIDQRTPSISLKVAAVLTGSL